MKCAIRMTVRETLSDSQIGDPLGTMVLWGHTRPGGGPGTEPGRLRAQATVTIATMIPISKMAAAVQPSATLAVGAKARQMKAEGIHVYDFSLGEPDFPTPEHICQAAVQAMRDGHTHYTPAAGIAELRGAIARRYQKTYGLSCTAEQVLV